jgi:hypothetical protein
VAPVEAQGFSRWNARLAAALRRIRPWLSRSHDGQVTRRCEAAVSRRSEGGSERGVPAAANDVSAIATTSASNFTPYPSAEDLPCSTS